MKADERWNKPFCEGFVQRVRNWARVSNDMVLEMAHTHLVTISDELLGYVDEFTNFVRHGEGRGIRDEGSVREVVWRKEKALLAVQSSRNVEFLTDQSLEHVVGFFGS